MENGNLLLFIKRASSICCLIINFSDLTNETCEEYLEELDHLCNHDGVIESIIGNKYHDSLLNILTRVTPEIQRKIIPIISKIIIYSKENSKTFISNIVDSLCQIFLEGKDNLTQEMALIFLSENFKENFNILDENSQHRLRNTIINTINWDNSNAIYHTLRLLNIGPDYESLVAKFMFKNIKKFNSKLKAGAGNEKMGKLICKLFLKSLDKIECEECSRVILESCLDDVLVNILFQSCVTISADYYLIVIKLLCKFLLFHYDSKWHLNKKKLENNTENVVFIVLQKFQSTIISFLLETLRRYDVKEITIHGFQIFYLTLSFTKTSNKLLNETNQEAWIYFILENLRNNIVHPDLIIWSFKVMYRIIIINPNLISLIENRENDLAIDSMIIQMFYTKNSFTPESFCATCDLQSLLSTFSEKMQNRFLESQTYTFIHMNVVRYFQAKQLDQITQHQIRMAAGKALKSLVIFNLPAKELFYNEEIQYLETKRFIMNVSKHIHKFELFEEPLAIHILFLASLVQYNPIKYDLMQGKNFDLRHILFCDICSKNPSIFEAVQELLIVLSGLDNETEFILNILSIEKCCEFSSIFLNVYAIQKNTMIFLQLNSSKLNIVKRTSILNDIATMIFRSTKLYTNSLIIKVEASVLIQILIKQYPEFVKVCVELDLDIFLFNTINLDINEDLVSIALQAFYVLTELNTTRESITQKAVKNSDLMMLQCMIAMGTDFSNISNEILLSSVKQKSEFMSFSLLSSVLLSGLRPNRYIINCCFDVNNYANAILLLQFYGIHESDNGHIINWSELGMKHFQVSWLEKLSDDLDVEINKDIKWLAKRIKQESRRRLMLRKHHEIYQSSQTKLLRYPATQTRTLEKKLGGYSYITINQENRAKIIKSNENFEDFNTSTYKWKRPNKDMQQNFSLRLTNNDQDDLLGNSSINDRNMIDLNDLNVNKSNDTKLKYKPIRGEINEFLSIFRSGNDYCYHSLDPRILLRDGSRFPRDSKEFQHHYGFDECGLNFYVKLPFNKNRQSNTIPYDNSDGHYFSDINSESKNDIIQISTLDISKNKLKDLNEFSNINKNVKLIQIFKNITTLKLERNLLQNFPDNTFQEMQTLEQLNLSENNLTEIPWNIFKYCPLIHLNISRNKIKRFQLSNEQKDNIKSYGKINLLLQLLLSGNKFSEFDTNTLAIFSNLQTLDINNISIKIMKDDILPLPNLKKINIKRNELESDNENLLKLSKNILSINFSNTQLSPINNTLQINLALFESLVSIDLSHNNLACKKPFFIPKCILKIPKLKTLDLSYNNITEFPPCTMWTSNVLSELNLSFNNIVNIDLLNSKTSFPRLQILDLSYNQLRRISPEIGNLSTLTYLNISHNPNLRELPDEIGLLKNKNLNSLIKEGLTLNIPKHFNQKTHLREILKYYYNRLRKSVEYNGLKVVVLGFGGQGKTSLLRSLQDNKRKVSQASQNIGIDVTIWRVPIKQSEKSSEYKFTCWDMSNQEEFLCSHECFLSQRALYLLVFDVTKNVQEVQNLKSWLWNLKSQAPHAPIIIVGTHVDKLKEENKNSQCSFIKSNITKLCLIPGFPKISDVVFVDSRSSNETINVLKSKIINVLNNHQFQNEIMMLEKQPKSYLKLEELLQETLKTISPDYPIITEKELKDLVNKNNLDLDGDELKQAIQFLHDCGVIVHFNDTLMNLNNLYFLKPQWLCNMMAKIITMKTLNTFIHDGIIKLSDFLLLFKKNFDTPLPPNVTIENHAKQCLKILQKFDVVFRQSSDEIIIPSKLPEHRPAYFLENVPKICRVFEFNFLPTGFWPRLITRIIVLAKSFEKDFHVCKSKLILWKTGVIISLENSVNLILEGKHESINKKDLEIIEISFTKSELGIKIFVQLVDCIEVLIDEWYPGLEDKDVHGNRVMEIYVICPNCESKIDIIKIAKHSQKSDIMPCSSCSNIYGEVRQFSIRLIAPDIVLGDIPNELIINPVLLEVNKCDENLIGSGGNGSVYKGYYRNVECAVKYINNFDYSNDLPSYRLLRQEIDILRKFRHPSLVSLIAVDRERIVLEFAPLRDLKFVLTNYKLTRRLLQRIAYQVINGIESLHYSGIIYRDIKMQNVLVFSLELSSNINVKLADYGIARPVAPFGFINPQGTHGYQAPEVLTKTLSYELPADIFSFGILLYNISTRGHHPADMKTHWRAGKQTEFISVYRCDNWPRMQDCIDMCTKLVPEDRPNAKTILDFIKCPSFIAVKGLWHLTKQTRIECMITMINNEENVEVFLANGNQFKQEVRRLNIVTGQSKGKPFLLKPLDSKSPLNLKPNRILSMILFKDFICLGTQSGELSLFNYTENVFSFTAIRFDDSILCMVILTLTNSLDVLMVGLANGVVQYKLGFTSLLNLEQKDFNKILISHSPVSNIYYSNKLVFVTCGSEIYKIKFSENDNHYELILILNLNPNKQDKLIKCFCPITENINNIVITTFYVTIRTESQIFNFDENGHQLKPTIDCKEIIKKKLNINENKFLTRIMCLALWSGDRYLAVGTGSGHLIIIDQKLDHVVVLSLFRNPIICIQYTKLSKTKRKSIDKSIFTLTHPEKDLSIDNSNRISYPSSGLIIVGNGYKSIESENFDGAVLIHLSDDLSNISKQLDKHINSRSI